MNESKEDNFEEGFVKACMEKGLNVHQTNELYKAAL